MHHGEDPEPSALKSVSQGTHTMFCHILQQETKVVDQQEVYRHKFMFSEKITPHLT